MDALLALLALFLTLAMWSSGGGPGSESMAERPSDAFALILALIGNGALIWRRRYSLRVHVIIVVCSALVLFGSAHDGIFAMAFSLYSLGRYTANQRASIYGFLAALAVALVDMFVLKTPEPGSVVAAGLIFLFWYVGRRLRFRGEYLRLLEERADYLERRKSEEANRAVAAERGRIARELHDIVAHQLSLMTVQAGAAKTVAAENPGAAIGAMEAVEHAGRQALAEMRHLLDVLRREDENSALLPQPGCADLTTLVAEVTAAGTPVKLHTSGRLSNLPPRVDLTVYRIVQEALTNVIKHGGGAANVEVSLASSASGISLRVSDTGRGPAAIPGNGLGIAGMRERAQMLGGWLRAGPGTEGGFTVEAFLPSEDFST